MSTAQLPASATLPPLDAADPAPECDAPIATASTGGRRAVIALGAAAMAGALLPSRAAAQAPRRRPTAPATGGFKPIIPNETPVAPQEWASDTTRLLRRITMGMTEADVAAAKRYGFRGYLERQLDYLGIDDSAVDAFVATKYPLLSQTSEQLYAANGGTVRNQLSEMTLYRAALSRRQLYERMVEFWSDHFNISINDVGYMKAVDDRDVIRKHALGKFRDLLHASAKSGAMMAYLDQNQSRVGSPNQNYAREIMELHTLGVDGGYTQNDVAELSRVLTGWTITNRGVFTFNPAIHDWAAKTVLGVNIPAGSPALGAAGIKEGERIIDLLLAHPSTATFLATKMLQWFVTYSPTPSQVQTVAAVYTQTDGDIKAMIRATLNSAWLRVAPMKLKRPFHFVASSIRAAASTVNGVANMNGQLNNVGQPLFAWDTPDGYPDLVEYWAGNILPRWSFTNSFANLATGDVIVDVAPYTRTTVEATIAVIDARLFAGEMEGTLRIALTNHLRTGAYNAARIRETIALALSANSFQWY